MVDGCLEELRRAFDELEGSLTRRVCALESDSAEGLQRKESISKLILERDALRREVLEVQRDCASWKKTCTDVIKRLDSSIKTLEFILGREKVSE